MLTYLLYEYTCVFKQGYKDLYSAFSFYPCITFSSRSCTLLLFMVESYKVAISLRHRIPAASLVCIGPKSSIVGAREVVRWGVSKGGGSSVGGASEWDLVGWESRRDEWKVWAACSLVDPASGSMYRDVTMAVVVITKRYVIVISWSSEPNGKSKIEKIRAINSRTRIRDGVEVSKLCEIIRRQKVKRRRELDFRLCHCACDLLCL